MRSQRQFQRLLAAALLIAALGHALALLNVLPFQLDLGSWGRVRFFGLDGLGGALFALVAASWLTAFRTHAPNTGRLVRALALLHLALAVAAVLGGSAWPALLLDVLLCFMLLVSARIGFRSHIGS